jgi:hypothetical protein
MARERTLQDCLTEVRRRWPGLPRAQRHEVAKWFKLLSRIEVLHDEIGTKELVTRLLKAIDEHRRDWKKRHRQK